MGGAPVFDAGGHPLANAGLRRWEATGRNDGPVVWHPLPLLLNFFNNSTGHVVLVVFSESFDLPPH
jgi:hypothetical protein